MTHFEVFGLEVGEIGDEDVLVDVSLHMVLSKDLKHEASIINVLFIIRDLCRDRVMRVEVKDWPAFIIFAQKIENLDKSTTTFFLW